MENVQLTIDGIVVEAPVGATILDAAKSIGKRIPTLCFLSDQKIKANCRVCLVEVEGKGTLQPACATTVSDGMQVNTSTPDVYEARRQSLQLILSNHPIDCQSCVRLESSYQEDLSEELCGYCFYCDCVRDGDCELQLLAKEYDINALEYEWTQRTDPQDTSTVSIVHNPNKCILSRRCVDSCGDTQGIHVWSIAGRGNETRVCTPMDKPLRETACVECGQCVRNCPVGALHEAQELDDILDAIQDKKKKVVVRPEPYFLSEYLKLSKQEDKGYNINNLVAGLHRLGVDAVVDNSAAEMEFVQQARKELKDSVKSKSHLPLISVTCPAVVQFVEKNYPGLVQHLSNVPSPQQIFVNNYNQLDGKEVYAVSLTPCSAKKAEAAGHPGDAQVMSPREINRLFTRTGVDLHHLTPRPLDISAGDGFIDASIMPVETGIATATLDMDGQAVKAVSVYGLRNIRTVLDDLAGGNCAYDYLQLLACPKGCASALSFLTEPQPTNAAASAGR